MNEEITKQTLNKIIAYMTAKEAAMSYKELWASMKEDFLEICEPKK